MNFSASIGVVRYVNCLILTDAGFMPFASFRENGFVDPRKMSSGQLA